MPHILRIVVLLAGLATTLSGCFWSSSDRLSAGSAAAPDVGACRVLTPADVAQPSNATAVVPCGETHTAQTFAVQSLPAQFADAAYDDPAVATFAYRRCSAMFMDFTGADQSLAMRTILTWAWFRPSRSVWNHGVRWYRCDIIGGGAQSRRYIDLPVTTRDLLTGRPKDVWLVCGRGETVDGSEKVPCSEQHDWRAVTTIVLGDTEATYPGDAAVQKRTKQFCSTSVGAWLGYPADYDFGYSWFQQDEWDAGNRRSVCWSRTSS